MWESFSPMQENIWQIAQLFPSCSFKFINWIRSRNTKKQWPAPFFPLTSYFSPAKFAIPWLGAGQSWCLCRKAQRRLPELPSWWYRNLPEDLGELTIYHNKVLWMDICPSFPHICPTMIRSHTGLAQHLATAKRGHLFDILPETFSFWTHLNHLNSCCFHRCVLTRILAGICCNIFVPNQSVDQTTSGSSLRTSGH
jgi:hypothetical protein